MSQSNPIKEWLARVAVECGNPLEMEVQARFVKNDNTRKLIVEYATLWARKLELRKRA